MIRDRATQGETRQFPIDGIWRTIEFRKLLLYAVFGGLLIATVVLLGEEVGHHIRTIEDWLQSIGPWGIVAFVALYIVLSSFFVPGTVMDLTGGVLFGVVWGMLAVSLGALLASSLQYLLSRHLFQDWIERKLARKATLVAIVDSVKLHQIRLQVLLRLSPLNPALVSYLLGAAGVRYRWFFLASFAVIPILFLEVFFGHAGKHLTLMATGDDPKNGWQNLMIIGGLIAGIVAIAFISRTARNAIQSAVAEANDESDSEAA